MPDPYFNRPPPSDTPPEPLAATALAILAAHPIGDFPRAAPVIWVLEGIHDIHFIKIASDILRTADASLPNLAEMERRGDLVFLPVGGGVLAPWADRLAPLGAQFHLYDREVSPETEIRRQIVREINTRPNCRAVLTSKRSLENYLHPSAVSTACGIDVCFGDFDSVPELLVKERFQRTYPGVAWENLPRRSRRRLADRAKRILNIRAAEAMTPELFAERDPAGEIAGWLKTVAELARRTR